MIKEVTITKYVNPVQLNYELANSLELSSVFRYIESIKGNVYSFNFDQDITEQQEADLNSLIYDHVADDDFVKPVSDHDQSVSEHVIGYATLLYQNGFPLGGNPRNIEEIEAWIDSFLHDGLSQQEEQEELQRIRTMMKILGRAITALTHGWEID